MEGFQLDTIYNEDCLVGMQRIPDGSVDCIICDLPYGTTQNKWDIIIPFDKLWEQYLRVAKENAAIVLFSQMPFTIDVVNSMRKYFRYELIWEKSQGSGFLNANKMPLKIHENILLFYRKLPTYNMQKTESSKAIVGQIKGSKFNSTNYQKVERTAWTDDGKRCPVDIIYFD
ncbi:MAG: hypothetical protein MJZ49_08550 [Bacteroidales bacterium]|nr:hypothetical protein [Bacteroidales bacterium]